MSFYINYIPIVVETLFSNYKIATMIYFIWVSSHERFSIKVMWSGFEVKFNYSYAELKSFM